MTRDQVRIAVLGREKKKVAGERLIQSAVLVPLLDKEGELHVLLTERTHVVSSHKGQVCFPGGTRNPDDGALLTTALRETWEETGVRPEDVEVVGEIDDNVVQSTGYVITPFVGFIPYPYPFRPNESETKDIFLVPLQLLRDPARFYRQERVISGYYYYGPVCDFDGHVIWGATGRILEHLVELLSPAVRESASQPIS